MSAIITFLTVLICGLLFIIWKLCNELSIVYNELKEECEYSKELLICLMGGAYELDEPQGHNDP